MVDTVKINVPLSAAMPQSRQAKGAPVSPSVHPSATGQPDVVRISDVAQDKAAQDPAVAENRENRQKTEPEPKPTYKAILALDEDKKVVVQVVDEQGEVVRQVPPEEYVEALKRLREVTNQLFHVKG